MLKNLILGSVAVLLLTACHKNSYKIEGIAEGFAEGDTLLVKSYPKTDDTELITVKDGGFSFKGVADSARLMILTARQNTNIQVFFFAEPSATVSIHLNVNGDCRVGGTKANDAWQELTDMCNEYERQTEILVTRLYSEDITKDELQATISQIRQLDKEKEKWMNTFLKRNKDNVLSTMPLKNL
jgi:hypothetical protein